MTDPYDDAVEAARVLRTASAALEAAKRALDEALASVHAALEPLATMTSDPWREPRLIALLRHLYWNEPQIRVCDLLAAFGFDHLHEMLHAIGSVPSGLPCSNCGRDIPRTARSWRPDPGPVCRDCYRENRKHDLKRNWIEYARRNYVNCASVEAPAWEWNLACAIVRAYPPALKEIPLTNYDDRDGLWIEFDSSLYVERVVRAQGHRDVLAKVRADAAQVLVTAALTAAGWDTVHVCQIALPFGDEAPTYVLSRLEHRIKVARVEAKVLAESVFPDTYQNVPYWRDEMRPATPAS